MKLNFSAPKARLAQALKTTSNYLDGSVNLRFLAHPAVRWALIIILALYVGVGIILGWKVYKVKSESANVRRILAIYPYPAALMPQDVILVRDYLNQLKYIRRFAEKTKNPLPPDNELRQQLINQMIETNLLFQEARRYGVRVTKTDIDTAYAKITETNGGPKEVAKLLDDLYGMNEAEFRSLIRDQLIREKFRKEAILQVQAKHILVRDEAKAKLILEQVKKEPAKFDEIAKQQSEDTASRDKSGDLGFFSRGVMAAEFEAAAFKLKKDEINPELVKTQFGFHIIKIVDRRGKIDKSYQSYIEELRKKRKIWALLK